MMHIDEMKCPQSHRCPMIPECPVGAISQDGIGLPIIDTGLCAGCGICVQICAMQAVYED
ncbi:MAG: 4Fe-4S binding protein [Rikenellaceae bacterium]